MTSGADAAKALVAKGLDPGAAMLSHPFPVVVACHRRILVAKGRFILLSADLPHWR